MLNEKQIIIMTSYFHNGALFYFFNFVILPYPDEVTLC